MGKRKRRDDGDQGHPIDGRHRLPRGPYGTNLGDIWGSFEDGGPVQDRLNDNDPGMLLVHEMMDRDGVVEEGMYVTRHPELVEKAKQGHPRWVAAQAAMN